ncbi:MAG: protein translocase subunit SecDF [Cyclobacteriaceae bacterium]|nr:protein translocase subunit SecDF [Cyclobacteriaceae bacterium]
MKNKGLVIVLTVIVTALCVYYLSFTFVSRNIQKEATAHATDKAGVYDPFKKRSYLDSIWNEPVYNLFGKEYTYKEIKDTELNLGLDLQGGMYAVLEVSPVDILKGLSRHSEDPAFLGAIAKAKVQQKNSQENFSSLFYQAFKEDNPGVKLAPIFANSTNIGKVSASDEDDVVMDFINEEINDAIERSFIIIRSRIDQFGTSQPNIQRIQGTARIQVEIPGADNPERVRKLLQGVAKLEFWEVAEISDVNNSLVAINDMLVAEMQLESGSVSDALQADVEKISGNLNDLLTTDTDSNDDTDTTTVAEDSITKDALDSLDAPKVSPLFALTKSLQTLAYDVKDTSKINRILKRDDVKALFPRTIRYAWAAKPFQQQEGSNEEIMELYFLKVGRGGKALLSGEVVTDATQDLDDFARPAVSMQMNATGAKIWKKVTEEASSKSPQGRIAVVLDNLVYTAPSVNGTIPNGRSQISGNFELEEAKDIANILKAGTLPAPTRIVEDGVIGPTLGKVAQKQGIYSIISGLVIVVLFMIAYYARGGFVANVALVFNIFFITGILAQLNAALTLPGIAGIVLTIGMSIDANVLIFERIREEMRRGVSLREAISTGYKKAYSSIVDANVTTALTALILMLLGSGPIKGFAVTLLIGIACSFFSAIFITRVIVEWMTRKGDESKVNFKTPLSKGLLSNLNWNFIGNRKKAYIVSSLIIVVGLTIAFTQGLNMGVDFKGGRSYIVDFNQSMVASEVKLGLNDTFEGAGTEVKTYNTDNTLKVTTSYLIDDESLDADNKVKDALVAGLEGMTGLTYIADDSKVDDTHFTISGRTKVDPTIADDIKSSSYKAGFFSIVFIFLYILIRFRKWQFSTGAIIALVHDTSFVFAAFAIAGLFGMSFEIDQVFVAALLTVIGYSINDTVVVFDRVRENLNLGTSTDKFAIFNSAINSTLNRTLITSVTTLIVISVLLIFGGEVLRGFSFALMIGVLVGTYSSIFIATPAVLDLDKKVE